MGLMLPWVMRTSLLRWGKELSTRALQTAQNACRQDSDLGTEENMRRPLDRGVGIEKLLG